MDNIEHAERTRPATVTMSTPSLVREFASLRVADAQRPFGLETDEHVRLGDVVNELRSRGVLD